MMLFHIVKSMCNTKYQYKGYCFYIKGDNCKNPKEIVYGDLDNDGCA